MGKLAQTHVFILLSLKTLLAQANVQILRSNICAFGETKVAADQAAGMRGNLLWNGFL